MDDIKGKGFGTRCIHAGHKHDKNARAHTVPIYQNSTYLFDDADQGARCFSGKEAGFKYTRIRPCSPTHLEFTNKLASLEGAEDAIAVGSGMAASSAIALTLLKKGDHFVSGDTLYGCTFGLFKDTCPKFGMEPTFVDTSKAENVENAIKPNTKMVFFETPANPTLVVSDIKEISKIAHEHDIPVVVDNTFATPYFQRPLELGADIVMHSCTKYIGGHGDLIGGVVAGSKEFIKSTDPINHNIGFTLGTHEAYLCIRGLKTLHIRMERHQENAMAVAKYLEGHKQVEWVLYPGLESHPQHALAKKQMHGYGAIISFGLKGGLETGKKLMNSLELMSLAVSLGSVDTLVQHPASMTHAVIPKEDRLKAGILDELVRLSIGIEDKEDLIADLEQAIAKAVK